MLRVTLLFSAAILLVVVNAAEEDADVKKDEKKDEPYSCMIGDLCKNNPKAPHAFFGDDVYCCKTGDSVSLSATSGNTNSKSETYIRIQKRDVSAKDSDDSSSTGDAEGETDIQETLPDSQDYKMNVSCNCSTVAGSFVDEEAAARFKKLSDDIEKMAEETRERLAITSQAMGGFQDVWDSFKLDDLFWSYNFPL